MRDPSRTPRFGSSRRETETVTGDVGRRRRLSMASSRIATAWATSTLAPLLLAGCVDTTGPAFPHIELTDFAPSLGIDLDEMTRIEGGIYVLDLVEGSGTEIGTHHRVQVGYTLFLADGTLVVREEEYTYRTGCRETVPRGLESGVAGMKAGGTRRIIIPGRWGYGSDPPEGIDVPYGAILVFIVEVERVSPLSPEFEC